MVRIDMIGTGANIKRLRCEKGYSVDVLSKKIKVSTQVIYNWQNGKYIPYIDNMVILAELFDVGIDDIIVTERVQII